MNLKSNIFTSKNEGSSHSIARKGGNFLKIFFGIAILVITGLTATNATYAQRNRSQSVCERYGYSDTNADLDGIWKLSFSMGSRRFDTSLAIRRQTGSSITSYWDADAGRTRRVSQEHRVCEGDEGIVILGFSPVDYDTGVRGEVFGYSADNYFITVRGNDEVYAYLVDDDQNTAQLNIRYDRELP